MSQIPPADPNFSGIPAGPSGPHSPAGNTEEVYYEGTPRLRGHLGHVVLYSLIGIAIIAIPVLIKFKFEGHISLWISLVLVLIGIGVLVTPVMIVKRTRYRITNYRIDYERGWLNTTINTIELWHVEDIQFQQSIFERMLGVGTIQVMSHDAETPRLFMRGIPHARQLFTTLEQRIIAVKRQQGVLKVDTGS